MRIAHHHAPTKVLRAMLSGIGNRMSYEIPDELVATIAG